MDRGAWWATVRGVTELDTTAATLHACMHNAGNASAPSRSLTAMQDGRYGSVDIGGTHIDQLDGGLPAPGSVDKMNATVTKEERTVSGA